MPGMGGGAGGMPDLSALAGMAGGMPGMPGAAGGEGAEEDVSCSPDLIDITANILQDDDLPELEEADAKSTKIQEVS